MHIYRCEIEGQFIHNQHMKRINKKLSFILIAIMLSVAGCASKSRPSLYPNEVFKKNGDAKAEADVDQCLAEADTYLKSPEGKKVARGGSVSTSIGVGTSIGIGSGGYSGVGLGVGIGGGNRVSGTDVKRMFVNQCLSDKGYQVLAWD